jgi:hypothetical protein
MERNAFGLAVLGAVVAAPAHAPAATITCAGWTHAAYTPGLTNTPAPTSVVVAGDPNVLVDHSPTGAARRSAQARRPANGT